MSLDFISPWPRELMLCGKRDKVKYWLFYNFNTDQSNEVFTVYQDLPKLS